MDRPEILRWTLQSLKKQATKRSFEVIVVDDGSAERPQNKIKKIDCPKNTSFINKNNAGAAAARNTGWMAAKGRIVIFLDCDQITGPEFVEAHCLAFDLVDEPFLQLATRRNLMPDTKIDVTSPMDMKAVKDERMSFLNATSYNLGNIEIAFHLCFSHNISTQRENLICNGGFDSGFKGWGFEDCEIAYRFKQYGIRSVLTPLPITYHQWHSQRMTRSKFRKWQGNLDYFINKYQTPEVCAQRVLIGCTDPDDTDAPGWTTALKQMENVLRLAKGRPIAEPPKKKLKFNDLDAIRKLCDMGAAPDFMALVSRRNLQLILDAQLDPNCDEARLFYY